MTEPRSFRFVITVTADEGQEGYNDPEWVADAVWGALSNEYGYSCTVDSMEEIQGSGP